MTRIPRSLAGGAIAGPATFGPVPIEVPELAYARPSGERRDSGDPEMAELRAEASTVDGHRSLRVGRGPTEIALHFPIPTPEVSGVPGLRHEAAAGIWVVHWPLAEAECVALAEAHPEAVILGNARNLWREGEPFVRAVAEIRNRLGGGPLLWTPRVGLPHRLAFLAWAGIDIVDTTEGLWQSAQGTFADIDFGTASAQTVRESRSCPCPSCSSNPPGGFAEHSEYLYRWEHARVRAAIRDGRLRELVEARLTAEPGLAEMLRYGDRHWAGLLEERTPVVGSTRRNYVLAESRRRPEVRRFIARILDRYEPPPSKRVLLLVPCSRTKPYRNSPSHRRFARAWEGLPHTPLVHVVSVSSPLGLVPRELEDVYPARHYDVPVTGQWEADERGMVRAALDRLLARGNYRQVVLHLDPREYSFLADAVPGRLRPRWTIDDDRTTSVEAIAQLRAALAGADVGENPAAVGTLGVVKEGLESLACFQFGSEAGRLLFAPPTRLEGRPWRQRLADGKHTDLATWSEERGLFQLTVAGGARILPARTLWVEVDPGLTLAGDLFTPGVRASDPGIRTGDAVVLLHSGVLLGVGEATLPGRLMTELPRGLAVRVRHRVPTPARSSLAAPPTGQ